MQQDQQRINKSILNDYSKDLLDIPNADKKYQMTLLLICQHWKNHQRKQYQMNNLNLKIKLLMMNFMTRVAGYMRSNYFSDVQNKIKFKDLINQIFKTDFLIKLKYF